MRCAGTSNVVTASTSVDLPDPMSPVSKAFFRPGFSAHTRPSKVPQLKTSRRSKRKPESASSATKSRPRVCASSIGSPSGVRTEWCLIRCQPRIEISQPLRVYKGLENATHLKYRRLPTLIRGTVFKPSQESQFNDLVEMSLNLVDQPGLIAAFGQEHPNHLDDLITGENEARVTAARVELGQLLAQPRQPPPHRSHRR